MNIFVARLNFETTSEHLESTFAQFGNVDSAKVITDKFTGKSKGFGFVEMPNDEEAYQAIEALNDSDLDGNTIVVKKSEPRENRGGGYNRNRAGGGSGYNNRAGGSRNRGGYGDRDNYGDRNSFNDRGGYRDRRDRGSSRRNSGYDNDRYEGGGSGRRNDWD